MRFAILVVLLSLVPVCAFAQAPDTTAAPDTAAVAAPPPPAATTPPPAAAAPAAAAAAAPPPSESGGGDSGGGRRFQIGAGVHYMETVGDIKDAAGFDSGALNLLLGARTGLGLIKLELDSEWSLDFGGTDHTLWIPQAYALIGGFIYGGAGIGGGYLDGEWFDNPVYTLRAGVNLPLGPIVVDANANYQFMSSKVLENLDTDDLNSVTFGATVWF